MLNSVALMDDKMLRDALRILYEVLGDRQQRLSFDEFLSVDALDSDKNKVIGEFVTLNAEFSRELADMKHILENYIARKDNVRPLTILLTATPGSGKSFLLKQNSKELGTSYEEFNLSTATSPGDVLDALKYIQAQNAMNATPIVLIDEVDTLIDNQYAFRFLLSPLSDGKVKDKANTIECHSAIMAFAGSSLFEAKTGLESIDRRPWDVSLYGLFQISKRLFSKRRTYYEWREQEVLRIKKDGAHINKLKDFLDRINVFLMLPPKNMGRNKEQYREELCQIAVSLVKKYFMHITEIELSYLVVIMTMLMIGDSKREAESLVFLTQKRDPDRLSFEELPEAVRAKFSQVHERFGQRFARIA